LRFTKIQRIYHSAFVTTLIALLAFGGSLWARPAALAQEQQPFDPSGFVVGFGLVAEGLDRPVQVVDPGDDSGRLFVVEQGGTIRVLLNGAVQEEPFLDISGQVSGSSEQGLLSMAFHPSFKENGTFFIDYTDLEGDTQVERWRVSEDDPNRADPGRVETILTVDQPAPNHNGGLLLFGPDGYLYVGLGDGGSQGDPNGHGQDLSTLLGSILRIDVDTTSGDLAYGIPEDNPFVNVEGARPEIWLYGLRNPWRFSFDRETGDLYIGDVGGVAYEEIDLLPAGGNGRNFGWNLMEGPDCYVQEDCDRSGLELPIFSYTHEFGCSVVGGYVYRGPEYAELHGVYLLADYCSGLVWGLGQDSNGAWVASDPIETGMSISSFGEDAKGELYVTDLNGGVYRVKSGP
jgi:glucose/arabinose dehydrogenase